MTSPRPYAGPPIEPSGIHHASFGTQEEWEEMHIARCIVQWRAQVERRRWSRDEVVEEYMRRKTDMTALKEENARLRALVAAPPAPEGTDAK